MVKTRTVVQTRTHAQKYFQKVSKSGGGEDSENEQEVAEEGSGSGSGSGSNSKAVPTISERSSASSESSSPPSKICNNSPVKKIHCHHEGGDKSWGRGRDGDRDSGGQSGRGGNVYDYYPYTLTYPENQNSGNVNQKESIVPHGSVSKRKHTDLSVSDSTSGQYHTNSQKQQSRAKGSSTHGDYPYMYTHNGSKAQSGDRSDCYQDPGSTFPLSLSCDSLIDFEGEGAQVLFMMKERTETNLNAPVDNIHSAVVSVTSQMSGTGSNSGSGSGRANSAHTQHAHSNGNNNTKNAPSLTIKNPDNLRLSSNGSGSGSIGGNLNNENRDGPDTPWESEVRALEARMVFNTRTSQNENDPVPSLKGPVLLTTTSEQRDFLKTVTSLLDKGQGGLQALETLLLVSSQVHGQKGTDDIDNQNGKI